MTRIAIFIILVNICTSCTTNGQSDATVSLPTSPDFPEPIGYVSDFDQLFTVQQAQTLDSLVAAFERETNIEIAIVTITPQQLPRDTTQTTRKQLFNYTLGLARDWHIGKRHKDNGILIGIANHFRQMRIQNSISIEDLLSDEATKEVIEHYFTPAFKKGQFYEGTYQGTLRIMELLR